MSLLVDLYILKSLVQLLEGSALIFQIQNQSISSFRCVRPQIASVLHVFSSVEEPNLLAHPGKCKKTTKNTKEIPKIIKKNTKKSTKSPFLRIQPSPTAAPPPAVIWTHYPSLDPSWQLLEARAHKNQTSASPTLMGRQVWFFAFFTLRFLSQEWLVLLLPANPSCPSWLEGVNAKP